MNPDDLSPEDVNEMVKSYEEYTKTDFDLGNYANIDLSSYADQFEFTKDLKIPETVEVEVARKCDMINLETYFMVIFRATEKTHALKVPEDCFSNATTNIMSVEDARIMWETLVEKYGDEIVIK